jgi:hypothetical protein
VERDEEGMIDRATIVRAGRLTDRFAHLAEYAGTAGTSVA